MQVFEQNNQLIIKGQPAFFNYLILAMLVVLIPVTAWGMWTSGEVSVWFIIAFVLAFGFASPHILNEIIKPSLVRALFDPVQKTMEFTMSGVMKKQIITKRFSDISKIELNIVAGHEGRTRAREANNTILKFNDGLEIKILKGSSSTAVKADFDKLTEFLGAARRGIDVQENTISRKQMIRNRA